MLASTNGTNWGSKFTSIETCIDGPVIAPLGTNLVWAWTGINAAHNLNTTLFNVV